MAKAYNILSWWHCCEMLVLEAKAKTMDQKKTVRRTGKSDQLKTGAVGRIMAFWAVVLLICVALAEFAAGVFIKITRIDDKIVYIESTLNKKPLRIGAFDEDLGWGMEPLSSDRRIRSEFDVSYAINEHGLRDASVALAKPSGVFRIVALGDSFVFGEGVNYGERFTEVTEDALEGVEVINMGVRGFGIDQSLLQLQRDGFQYSPDMVMVFVCNPSFIARSRYPFFMGKAKPHFIPSPDGRSFVLEDLKAVTKRFSAQLKKEDGGLVSVRDKESRVAQNDLVTVLGKSNIGKLLRWRKIKQDIGEFDREFWGAEKARRQTEFEAATGAYFYDKENFRRLLLFFLKEFKDLCDAHQADLVVVSASLHLHDYPVGDYCKQLAIAHVELYDVLAGAAEHAPLQFAIDSHGNEFYHRLVGESVSIYLKERYHLKGNSRYTYENRALYPVF